MGDNPVFFVPNLIGYVRVATALASFFYIQTDPWVFGALYSVSYALDAVDGPAARALNQASQFGAVLDMVTDRACTNVLLLELSRLYGDYRWLSFFWTACASLDLVSHWWHMHQSLSQGASSHKALGKERSWLLRIYYSRVWLFLICAANEACLLLAYAAARPETAGLDVRVARSALPEQVLRARSLGWLPWLRSGVEEEGPLLISLTACLALVTAPVFLLKQLISAVQLAEAAALTAEQDARDRKAKREAMERAKL